MAEQSIQTLQLALCALGFRAPLNGQLDEATMAALRDFQVNECLPVTGQADEVTWEALDRLRQAWEGKDYLIG
ncbi:MAG: peptidoglycan-binding protein [Actinomycetia bacterium]|nr:peptidoglycan-binding protein [Actinomycetes bacterium]